MMLCGFSLVTSKVMRQICILYRKEWWCSLYQPIRPGTWYWDKLVAVILFFNEKRIGIKGGNTQHCVYVPCKALLGSLSFICFFFFFQHNSACRNSFPRSWACYKPAFMKFWTQKTDVDILTLPVRFNNWCIMAAKTHGSAWPIIFANHICRTSRLKAISKL